jgi:hypothetical protein
MSKINGNFWAGLIIGTLGGLVAAQKLFNNTQMPNAKVWQRILSEQRGEMDAAVFMAKVQERYQELKSRRPLFENHVFNSHVVGVILPGLALYLLFKEDGMDQEAALAEVDSIFDEWFQRFPPLNMRMNQMMHYFPENWAIFRKLVHFTMEKLFPAPGWQYELVADDDQTYAFNIHHCFYLDILNYYGAPELTPAFCKLDDYLMAAMPDSIQWGRTQTIGKGAECCDFRWDYVPTQSVK